ncbi:beta 1-4 rhamnosyltransferase Cps2T [Clostridium felsineum]|uniref:beta 1-4 rhamnosyltransferase Cps2T n=1 Tax=Clostridium felsineum TaxID=36839 RepID=UPI00098CDB6F|nr:DUF1972 domain-containing protein [Clostridium felsineum]URZ14843.1 hypothetical protein CLFE_008560 [Clostridium felsineum DSM 794]
MKHIFIIGSKGIPANYGGFETFVDKLTEKSKNEQIHYYVSCMGKNNDKFVYNNANCFNVKVPKVGSASAVIYDIMSLIRVRNYIKQKRIGSNSIIYILACRIGPFLNFYKKYIKTLEAKIYINPDGHEWKRSKWNCAVKKYWKISEKLMIKSGDIVVCDSIGIERYINDEYKKYNPKTVFIPYGAEIIDYKRNINKEVEFSEWMKRNDINNNNYYLVVGRFVPENNYEFIIKEFMNSKTQKDLVLVTNSDTNLKFYNYLVNSVRFVNDKRIKFVGTIYDEYKLHMLRSQAFAYIHGHSVGGTNPSLLEALATTKLNLLYNVIFNREVGQKATYYFDSEERNLSCLIEEVEKLSNEEIKEHGELCKNIISNKYSWKFIVEKYEKIFLQC